MPDGHCLNILLFWRQPWSSELAPVSRFHSSTPLSPPQSYELIRWSAASIVQELCESRGGRPELSVLTSLLVSVDVKLY